MTTRRWLAGAALVAVAVVVCVATCRRDDEPPPSEITSPTKSPESRDAAKPKVPRASPVAATDAAPAEATTNATSDASDFPAIDVEVVLADGTPCPGADVYALPAGAPGRRTIEECPHAKTRADGRGRLVMPRSGTFDVGVTAGLLHAFASDVVVPRSEPLRLTMQPTAEVRVVADEEVSERLSHGNGPDSWVSLQSAASVDARRAFGRGEPPGWCRGIWFPAGTTEVPALLPADGDVHVVTSPDLRAWPTIVRPPGTVTLSWSNIFPAALRLRFTPPDVVAKADGWISVVIDTGDGEARVLGYHFVPGKPDPHLSMRSTISEWFPATGGIVRWHGRGIAAGETTVGASTRARPAAADLTIVLDGTPLSADPPEDSGIVIPRTATFDVTLNGYGSDSDAGHAFVLSDAGSHAWSNSPRGEVRHLGSDMPGWLAASHGDRVAPPRRVTEAMAGPVGLALEPGGFLVVECATKPPDELGRITIVRKDGAPLIFMGTDLLPSIDAITGNKIGPLPPGEHAFVLRLAGFDVGEVTATVVAGETTELVLPHVPPR